MPKYINGVAILFVPEEDCGRVIIKDHWAVDNGRETATFGTREECVEFAQQRWGWRGES